MNNSFKCKSCGNCCRMPGYVRVSAGEIARIAAFLDEDIDEFKKHWTAPTHDGDTTLLEKEDQSCIYLDENNHCIINPVKPRQCRDFPHTWRYKDMEKVCMGAKELKNNKK